MISSHSPSTSSPAWTHGGFLPGKLRLVPIVAVAILGALGWWIHSTVERAMKDGLREESVRRGVDGRHLGP